MLSRRVCDRLASLPLLDGSGPLLAFHPLVREEVDLRPWLWDELAAGRVLALPRIDAAGITPCRIGSLEELQPSAFGTRDPGPGAAPLPLEQLHAVLVPGLAFQRAGGLRLGRGGGFYDRLLAQLPPAVLRIGLCFHDQLRSDLPRESHDQTVQFILTEQGLHFTAHPREDPYRT